MSNQNLREQLRQQEAESLAQSVQFNRWSLVMISVMIHEQEQKLVASDQPVDTDRDDNFWADVYNYQFKRIKNENDAEDITVQTFSRAFDKIDTFNTKYQFKTWLITISKNIHIA